MASLLPVKVWASRPHKSLLQVSAVPDLPSKPKEIRQSIALVTEHRGPFDPHCMAVYGRSEG